MTLIASIHGRLGSDPKASTTQAGKEMTRANIAVDVTGRDGEEQTLWVSILAFGKVAETLARAAKGESCTAMGRMTRGTYAPPQGEPREQWTLLADAVIVAKSARPTGRKPSSKGASAPHPAAPGPELDDELAF